MPARRIAPLTALAAALALPLSLAVAAPAAAATVTVNDWGELTTAIQVDGDTIVLGADVTAPNSGSLAVDAGESVTLDLNGYTLTVTSPAVNSAAVHVPSTSTLTVDATGGGTLNATGDRGAGIGGGHDGGGGTVTITGGTINATGGLWGAGIGGGFEGDGGTVMITGGTINATGGRYAPGIGGGFDSHGGIDGGTVMITGGTINATGGSYGAGIGGGAYCDGGTVTIYGGTINAAGGSYAAGIGGGEYGDGGTVTIYGGTISAAGGSSGPGIGGGDDGDGGGGTLEIHGIPDVGAATTGGTHVTGGAAAPITNPTEPAGVGYSANTSMVGNGGRIVVDFHYLIAFDSAGGTAIADQAVNEGDSIPEPADPTRTGYQFAGWQLATLAYDFTSPVHDPVTLTAAWTPVLAATGADPGPILPIAALILILLGGTLHTAHSTRRAA